MGKTSLELLGITAYLLNIQQKCFVCLLIPSIMSVKKKEKWQYEIKTDTAYLVGIHPHWVCFHNMCKHMFKNTPWFLKHHRLFQLNQLQHIHLCFLCMNFSYPWCFIYSIPHFTFILVLWYFLSFATMCLSNAKLWPSMGNSHDLTHALC